MPDIMEFPKYWEDFIKDYSFKDDQHIYTNGSELISIYRVKQMVNHYFSTGVDAIAQAVEKNSVERSKGKCERHKYVIYRARRPYSREHKKRVWIGRV